MVGRTSSCCSASGAWQGDSPQTLGLLAVFERGGEDFALEGRIQRDEDGFDGLRAEPRGIPLAAGGVEQGLGLERLQLLHLIDGSLQVGEGVGELLIGEFEGDNFGDHVRGLVGDLLGGQATRLSETSLNFAQLSADL